MDYIKILIKLNLTKLKLMKKELIFLLLVILAAVPTYAQFLSTPGGMVADNGTADNILLNGYTQISNPNGRTLTLTTDNGDSWLMFHDPGDYWYSMGIDHSNSGAFTLNFGGQLAQTSQFVMTKTGNVGIGTTSPNEKLTVNGTIYAREIKVDLSVPGPDYVFEKDYPLPSLQELERFIQENKHLPNVPPASIMELNGIELGSMNMALLRKIEELTLYVILLQKENQRQDELIEQLRRR